MAPITSSIEIDRPPAEVFAYAADPRRWPEWQGDVVRVHVEGDRAPTLGARFTTTRRIGGVERAMTQEVVEDEPPRRWAAHGVDGPVRPDGSISIEPLDGGARSLVTFSLDFAGHGFGKQLLPLVRRMTQKVTPVSYQRLKERLESGEDRGGPPAE